jgi:hypothetical protein
LGGAAYGGFWIKAMGRLFGESIRRSISPSYFEFFFFRPKTLKE